MKKLSKKKSSGVELIPKIDITPQIPKPKKKFSFKKFFLIFFGIVLFLLLTVGPFFIPNIYCKNVNKNDEITSVDSCLNQFKFLKLTNGVEEVQKSLPPQISPRLPLTGDISDNIPEISPISAVIDNSTTWVKPAGIERADIVWEKAVEGGLSRLIATFHSNLPDHVGPIRSIRDTDHYILQPLNGSAVLSGAKPAYLDSLETAKIKSFVFDQDTVNFTTSSANAPYKYFANIKEMSASINRNDQKQPEQIFNFATSHIGSSAALTGQNDIINTVTYNFSKWNFKTIWKWNSEMNVYYRYLNNDKTPSVTEAKTQIAVNNVIILNVNTHKTNNYDDNSSQTIESDLLGEGEGTIFSAGHKATLKWQKYAPESQFILMDATTNQLLKLSPGKTWIVLLPNGDGSLTAENIVATKPVEEPKKYTNTPVVAQ
jgi:hypothetical protein